MARAFGLEDAEQQTIEIEPADLREAHGLVQSQLALSVGSRDVNVARDLQPDMWESESIEAQIEVISQGMKDRIWNSGTP